jgi:hypothetical protein
LGPNLTAMIFWRVAGDDFFRVALGIRLTLQISASNLR